ncbi:MAG TPA: SGNH/GDSL hydrolase family protein [Candidatus Saccharimonadales bacterium]|nr:SGNH/GDSL hydrolase family protein [Candidatus Saccharimonadales bacterium]
MKKTYRGMYLSIAAVLFILLLFYIQFSKHQNPQKNLVVIAFTPTVTVTPTPFIFTSYTIPKIPSKQVYKIVMVGDSMTAALGPHGGGLSEYMNSLYKKNVQDPQRIVIDNYAKSSNILAVNDQLTQKTSISEYTFGPLLSEDFDLILVESYGYNPLSQFGLEGGLKQQNLALDALMKTLITTHPHAVIAFVATIAPNRTNYAKATQPNYSATDRAKLADERIAYIKNHIAYAKSHNIPLIDIFKDSLTKNGDGSMVYINPTDDIHPSFAGVTFIDHEIGNFIHDTKILPQ